MTTRTRLDDIGRRIGGPHAVTWPGCWIALGFALLFGSTAAVTSRSGFGWLPPVLVGHFTAYGVLALVRRRIAGTDPRRPRPARAIAAFAGAAVVGSIASGIVNSIISGGSSRNADASAKASVSPALAVLSVASTVVAFTLLTAFSAVVVDAWAEHRQRSVEYQHLVELLVDLRSRGFARVAEARDTVRRTALDALTTLAVDSGELATPQLRDSVRSVALDVIRPLSHRLADEPLPLGIAPTPPQWSARTFIVDATAAPMYAPTTLALLAEIPVLLYVLLSTPGKGLSIAAPAAIIATAFTAWLTNSASPRALVGNSVVRRAGWWVGSVAVITAGQAAVWFSSIDSDAGRAAGVLSCCTTAFFGIASPTWRAARTALTRDVRERDGLNAAIELERSRVAQYEWAERAGLAHTLHGQVQSALLACALRLHGSADDADRHESAREQLDRTLADLVSALDGSSPTVDIPTACRNLTATWRGVCDVSFQPLPVDALDPGSSTAAAFVAVITEAVSNAVRHGAAIRVDIAATASDDECLEVAVRAQGDRLLAMGPQQLGFSLFERVARSWALNAVDGGTVLTARLPIDRHPTSPRA